MNTIANVVLYANTSLPDALTLSSKIAEDFFETKVFANWKQAKENEWKYRSANVDRLNEVIRATGIVAKTIAKTGRRL